MGLSGYLRQLDGGDWLGPLYEAAVATEPEHWESEPGTFVRPSSAGTPCATDAELALLGHRTARTAAAVRRMENGRYAEERVRARFVAAGLMAPEVPRRVSIADADGWVTWSGEIDLAVRRPRGSDVFVGDVKTANAARYRRWPAQDPDRERMAETLEAVERDYVRQLTQYVVAFQEAGYAVSDECFFFVENTDTQDYRVIWLRPGAELRRRAFAVARAAQTAALAGRLFEQPFARDSTTCRACRRKRVCDLLRDGDEATWATVNRRLAVTSAGP